jgi:hypothetical protein
VATFTGSIVNSRHRLHEWEYLGRKYDYLIGSYLRAYLSGIKDAGFLEKTFNLLLDDVSLSVHKGM